MTKFQVRAVHPQILGIFFGLCILSFPGFSFAATGDSCGKGIISQAGNGASAAVNWLRNERQLGRKWLSEFREEMKLTRGGILIMKPGEPNEKRRIADYFMRATPPWEGLPWYKKVARACDIPYQLCSAFRQNPPQSWAKPISGSIDFLFGGVIFGSVDWLTAAVTRPLLGRPYRWNMAGMLLVGFLTFWAVEHGADLGLDQWASSLREQHRTEYLELIENDYRFDDVRGMLAKGEIDEHKALEVVDNELKAIRLYFEVVRPNIFDGSPWTEEKVQLLIDKIPLFAHLKPVLDSGPKPSPGFDLFVSTAQLTDAQIREKAIARAGILLDLEDRLIIESQLIDDLIRQSPDYVQRLRTSTALSELSASLESDPFTLRVQKIYSQGKISRSRMKNILQEFAYWRVHLMEWEVLGYKKIKSDNPKTYATLEDFADDLLAEFEQR